MRKPSKYWNKKVTVDGVRFDSKREATRYQQLKLMQQAGEISRLTLQPRYTVFDAFTDRNGQNHRRIDYIADFEYLEDDGQTVVEDVKGKETEVFRIKRKLFLYRYPELDFRII